MRSASKKPHATDPSVRVFRAMGQSPGDRQGKQLAQLQRRMGNQAMGKVGDSASARDAMVQFILHRLKAVHGVQQEEHAAFKDVREWYRDVAKGRTGFSLPDPTRWHACARLFQDAIHALCHGNVTRGAQLLESALGAEKAAYDSLPAMVKRKLSDEDQRPEGPPDAMEQGMSATPCTACALPAELVLAQQILSISDIFQAPPPYGGGRRRAWWDEEVGEDDDEKKAGADAKQATQTSGPAAQSAESRPDHAEQGEEEDQETEELQEKDQDQSPEKESAQADKPKARRKDRGILS